MSEKPVANTPELRAWESVMLDRRKFLNGVSLTAGVLIAATVTARAADGTSNMDVAPPSVVASSASSDRPEALWDVDDMWGHRPRYAQPIPYAHGIAGAGPLESSGP